MENLRYNEVSDHEVFDFVRCQRPDGSFYGTSGTCRKGVQVGAKEKAALKKAAKAGNKKAKAALDVVEGKKTPAQARAELGMDKAKPKKEPKKKPAPKRKKKAKVAGDETGTDNKKTGVEESQRRRESLKSKKGREAALQERNALYREFNAQAAPPPPEKTISRKNAKSIEDYTRDRPPTDKTSYSNMNNCARNPPSCTPEAQKANSNLDAALKSAPTNSTGGAYYRGMNLTDNPQLAAQLEGLKPGDTFSDGGFGSYSRSPAQATTFLGDRNNVNTRNIMMISKSKKLRQIEEYSDWPDELEGILPRNTGQTVRSVRHVGNTTYIEVD